MNLFPAEEDVDEEVLRSVEEGFEESERCHGPTAERVLNGKAIEKPMETAGIALNRHS